MMLFVFLGKRNRKNKKLYRHVKFLLYSFYLYKREGSPFIAHKKTVTNRYGTNKTYKKPQGTPTALLIKHIIPQAIQPAASMTNYNINPRRAKVE